MYSMPKHQHKLFYKSVDKHQGMPITIERKKIISKIKRIPEVAFMICTRINESMYRSDAVQCAAYLYVLIIQKGISIMCGFHALRCPYLVVLILIDEV